MYSDFVVFVTKCLFIYCFLSLVAGYRGLYLEVAYIREQNKKLSDQLKLSFVENKSLWSELKVYEKSKFHADVDSEKARYATRSVSKSKSPKKER